MRLEIEKALMPGEAAAFNQLHPRAAAGTLGAGKFAPKSAAEKAAEDAEVPEDDGTEEEAGPASETVSVGTDTKVAMAGDHARQRRVAEAMEAPAAPVEESGPTGQKAGIRRSGQQAGVRRGAQRAAQKAGERLRRGVPEGQGSGVSGTGARGQGSGVRTAKSLSLSDPRPLTPGPCRPDPSPLTPDPCLIVVFGDRSDATKF